jgi:Cell morphogenesis C-terminal
MKLPTLRRASQLKMYPQLFWATLALLQSAHVSAFLLALAVLDTVLASLHLWNLPSQQILLAGVPVPQPDSPLPSGMLRLLMWDSFV